MQTKNEENNDKEVLILFLRDHPYITAAEWEGKRVPKSQKLKQRKRFATNLTHSQGWWADLDRD